MHLNKQTVTSQPDDKYLQVRAKLNGAKTLEPLLLGILRYPGVANDPERLSEATSKIISLHTEVSTLVCEQLAPGNQSSAISAIISTPIARLIGSSWGMQTEALDAKILADMFMKTVEFSEPEPAMAFTDLPRATDDALVRAKAVSQCLPVFMRLERLALGARTLFIGKQENISDAIKIFRDEIQKRSEAIADHICPADNNENQQQIAYKSVLNRVANTTADLLNIEYAQLGKELQQARKTGKSKDKEYVKQFTDSAKGVLTERVFAQVDNSLLDLFGVDIQAVLREDETHAPS